MAKRNMLIWGDADAGKSTFAATMMDLKRDKAGVVAGPARWPRVDWFNLDKPGKGSIAQYFGEGSQARFIEVPPGDWRPLAAAMAESTRRAKRGDIDAIVVEGLSVYYSNDAGLAALENPDAVTAGGNHSRALYKAPRQRLDAILAGAFTASAVAKSEDFLLVLTAHAKEVGDGEQRKVVPDVSRNVWRHFVRLCEVVLELNRHPGRPPTLTYKRKEDDLVLARVNTPGALAFLDKIHAARDEAQISKMRTIPGLVALLDHAERKAQDDAAKAAQPADATTST